MGIPGGILRGFRWILRNSGGNFGGSRRDFEEFLGGILGFPVGISGILEGILRIPGAI